MKIWARILNQDPPTVMLLVSVYQTVRTVFVGFRVQMLLEAAKGCHTAVTKNYKLFSQAVFAEITDNISEPRCTPTCFVEIWGMQRASG